MSQVKAVNRESGEREEPGLKYWRKNQMGLPISKKKELHYDGIHIKFIVQLYIYTSPPRINSTLGKLSMMTLLMQQNIICIAYIAPHILSQLQHLSLIHI